MSLGLLGSCSVMLKPRLHLAMLLRMLLAALHVVELRPHKVMMFVAWVLELFVLVQEEA